MAIIINRSAPTMTASAINVEKMKERLETAYMEAIAEDHKATAAELKDILNDTIFGLNEVIGVMMELLPVVNSTQTGGKPRDRGPKSERSMTNEDAWRVMYGDLKGKSHKAAAQELGLSYGQVYSARGGYTFTAVKPDDYSITESKPVTEENIEELLDGDTNN